MMIIQGGIASVGIRGGDTEAVKAYLSQKSARDLCQLEYIILYIGGNNLARRDGETQVPGQPAEEVSRELEGLVRFTRAYCPQAAITTADLIPRSTQGFFNHRARLIAANIIQQDPKHHHVSFL